MLYIWTYAILVYADCFNLQCLFLSGMKIIPVAPGLNKADSLVLLKANYPVKKKDLLSLEYRVKAGASCNLEIKVMKCGKIT